MKVENEEFRSRLHSADTKEAMTALLEKLLADFARVKQQLRVSLFLIAK